jgi:acetylornithine/N-succinyldiaminopimelate aminotransferase
MLTSMRGFTDFDVTPLMRITDRPELMFVGGDGCWLWDQNGTRYLDFVQGWAVNTFGHCPGVVTNALAAQSRTLITPGPGFYNAPALALARRITTHSSFDQVFFTNTGAEANEGAIKLARKWGHKHKGGAYEIITFESGFHGRSLTTMSASGKPQFAALFEPKVPGFPKAALNDLKSVERLITSNTVGVMLEPIQGEGGVNVATDQFLQDLRGLTRDRGLLMIVDEIQTGVGRTGRLWAHEYAGIEPDVMTLGKMLGGGVPLSAMATTHAVACFDSGDQGGTFNGNPLMAAVGCAVLDAVLARGMLDHVCRIGNFLSDRLREISDRHQLAGVRGRGLLWALDLGVPRAKTVVERARSNALLVDAPRPHLLRFMPALNVSREDVATMATILDASIRESLG